MRSVANVFAADTDGCQLVGLDFWLIHQDDWQSVEAGC